MVFSADGMVITSISDDKTVYLWDEETGSCKCTLSGYSGYVTTASCSCFFANVWCVLNIEYFTGLSGVFVSLQMTSTLSVEAWTKPSRCK